MSFEGITEDERQPWGKEIRWSKMGGGKSSTDTGVPAPELVLY